MQRLFTLLLLCLAFSCSYAQIGGATPASTPATSPASTMSSVKSPAQDVGPLVLFSRQVFVFRAANHGISPADRATRARTRIHEQLKQAGSHQVTVHPDPSGMQIRIDNAGSFVITPADLDPTREETLEQTASIVAAALTTAIQESMESRSIDTLLRALGKSVVASAIFTGILWLANRGRHRLTRRLARATAEHSKKLRVGGATLFQSERLTRVVHLATTLLYHFFVLVLTINWLSYVLQTFPFTRAWGESLSSFLFDLARPLFLAALASVPELLTAALIFYIAYLITKAIDQFFINVQNGITQVSWLDNDIATPSRRITKFVVWLFSLAMAYPYLPGSDTEAFKGLSVLLGLMLSMGASSLVGQAASGLILTYGRAFRKGEFVRVADNEGTVTEMGIFTTRIRNGLGEEITLSNASILSGTTKNYSRAVQGTGFVLDATVTIGYDTPWRQVHAMLIEAAMRTPGVLHTPTPQVFQTSLSDWYPVYRLVCQAIPEGPTPRAIVMSNLLANIQDTFNTHGVAIMSPHYIADPQEPKVVPPTQWFRAPATMPEAGETKR